MERAENPMKYNYLLIIMPICHGPGQWGARYFEVPFMPLDPSTTVYLPCKAPILLVAMHAGVGRLAMWRARRLELQQYILVCD